MMSTLSIWQRRVLPLATACFLLLFTACADTADQTAADAEMADDTAEMMEPANTIVDIAQSNPDFSTLVTALQTAGLVETLSGDGPFTVFAPTNAAFDALPEGTVESLLQPENRDRLTQILTYHVASGSVMAADVVQLDEVETLEGSTADITVNGETVMVGGATVVQTNIEASNGVIHVIDAVLLPAEDDAM